MTNATLPTQTEQLAPRLRLAVMRLARRLRQQAEHDVTPSMLSALSSIERLGPLTLGELAEAERVRPPTITKVIGRLDDEGLIVREPDPTDHRVARVRLSRRGAALVSRARGRKDAFLARRLSGLSDSDVASLEAALGAIERILAAEDE